MAWSERLRHDLVSRKDGTGAEGENTMPPNVATLPFNMSFSKKLPQRELNSFGVGGVLRMLFKSWP